MEDTFKATAVKTADFIKAGVMLVAALAWNDVIQEVIINLSPYKESGIVPSIIHALFVTMLAILLIANFDTFFPVKDIVGDVDNNDLLKKVNSTNTN